MVLKDESRYLFYNNILKKIKEDMVMSVSHKVEVDTTIATLLHESEDINPTNQH